VNNKEKKQLLFNRLFDFIFYNFIGQPENCVEYDSYRRGIRYIGREGVLYKFSFSMQLSGSPEGDIWWNGEFTLHWNSKEITIVEDEYKVN